MNALKYFITFLTILALIIKCSAAPLEHWRVQVSNHMPSGDMLLLHCKSKDDDLGRRNLGVGQQFSWRFRENLWQTTLYRCYMRSRHVHVSLEVFWPEAKPWLAYRCSDNACIWSVRDDGIYLKNVPENKFELHAKWEHGW